MSIPLSRTRSVRTVLSALSLLSTGCATGPTTLLPIVIPTPLDPFFGRAQAVAGVLNVGDELNIPGGASVCIPRTSPAAVELVAVQAAPAPETVPLFSELNAGAVLAGHILRIDVRPRGPAPPYLIVQMPATAQDSRLYVAGYVDEDTGQPDWTPVRGTYDPGAGVLTAAVGLGLFQPVEQDAGPIGKIAATWQSGGSVTYSGYVGVGVGGQQFNAQIIFIVEEPTSPLEVPFEGPPIAVRARVGARLSNITHQPLDMLTVTSNFGPRPQPVQGASTNHRGVDYRAADGTNVYAAGDGTVIRAGCQTNSVNCGRTATGDITGGNIVEIDHGNGEVTRYMHLTNPASVGVGDTVRGGQVLGQSDSTGGVAAHLHFEVQHNGVAVNPQLIYNQMATVTIAMAIDYEVQSGSQRQLPVTRGILTPPDLARYDEIVDLTGVEPGPHRLQFVAVEPGGTLEVLAEAPLTVGQPFLGLTGAQLWFEDLTTVSTGSSDYESERLEAVFSLVAIDGSRLQGQAHLTYFRLVEVTRSYDPECPVSTDTYGPVEWDAFLEGEYQVLSDGGIYVSFTATPSESPDVVFRSTRPGCPFLDASYVVVPVNWNGTSATLINGRYDDRSDTTLGSATGERYYETHLRWVQP